MKYFCHAILRIIGATDEIIFIAFEAPTDYVMTTLLFLLVVYLKIGPNLYLQGRSSSRTSFVQLLISAAHL